MLKVERLELTVTGAEGIDMGIGMGFFADAGSGAIVCPLSPEVLRCPER